MHNDDLPPLERIRKYPENPQWYSLSGLGKIILGIFIILKISFWVLFVIVPPRDFPTGEILSVPEGSALSTVAEELKEEGYIRSANAFKVWMMVHGKQVIAGDYMFDRPLWLFGISHRLAFAEYGDSRISVFLPEGFTVEQMADRLEDILPNFNKDRFLRLAEDDEGYLFPDTYLFFPSTDEETVYFTLREAFADMLAEFNQTISESEWSEHDIITMASIIEREAFDDDTERAIISGILWRRIAIGMPLQVDATFVYFLGKGSAELTLDDLAIDHPYNTYQNLGLPPGPIANPGRDSIYAALNPQESPYLFYLHGNDGIVRYARNHDGHVQNKNLYLR